MMSTQTFDADGRLIEWRDDAARLVHRYDAQGDEILPATPYTAEENAAADAADADAAEQAAHEAQRVIVRTIITDLQAEKARADAVIAKSNAQITGGDTKDVARAAKRIADAAIDLARLVKDV